MAITVSRIICAFSISFHERMFSSSSSRWLFSRLLARAAASESASFSLYNCKFKSASNLRLSSDVVCFSISRRSVGMPRKTASLASREGPGA